MIEAEQAAEAGAAHDSSVVVRGLWFRINHAVSEALVIPLEVVVRDVFGDDLAQVPLAEGDDEPQAFLADRADEALGVRVQVRASCWA